jgi:hypothetical protein
VESLHAEFTAIGPWLQTCRRFLKYFMLDSVWVLLLLLLLFLTNCSFCRTGIFTTDRTSPISNWCSRSRPLQSALSQVLPYVSTAHHSLTHSLTRTLIHSFHAIPSHSSQPDDVPISALWSPRSSKVQRREYASGHSAGWYSFTNSGRSSS